MYDFAHGQSDSIEHITHSICTLEFIHHRPLYDWFIQQLGIFPSHQYEFARRNGFKFNLTYLPRDIPDNGSAGFETGYMRSLFAYGYDLGRSGQAWQSSPPEVH